MDLVSSNLDLSSEPYLIITTLNSSILTNHELLTLHNYRTDLNSFCNILESTIPRNILLKTTDDIDYANGPPTHLNPESCMDGNPDSFLQPTVFESHPCHTKVLITLKWQLFIESGNSPDNQMTKWSARE